MSGATLINPNQERNYFMNKPMSNVNQPLASSSQLNFLVNSSSVNNFDSSKSNGAINSRREYFQKQTNNIGSAKNNHNFNNNYNNNNNNNVNFNERQQINQNSNQQKQQLPANSYSNYQRENRKQSPYCRDRQSSDSLNDASSKTKAIQKQYKTLKLTKKFDLTDNVKRQQMLRINMNCFQNKYSKVNNNIIPTLPKFLVQSTLSLNSINKPM